VRVTLAVLVACVVLAPGGPPAAQVRPADAVAWADLGPLQPRLEALGLTADAFPGYLRRLRETHAARIRDGDFDHLVFYLLQSTRFTSLPPVEPALGAKALVDGLAPAERGAYLGGSALDPARVPADVRVRIAALLQALDGPLDDARLRYFGELARTSFPDASQRAAGIAREYLRTMRFLYEKEFVAQRSATPAEAVAGLYRSRGLSTDTAVEAGFLVSTGLGILRAIDPDRRIRQVLIVGPGLDLAPRTALVEEGRPESYQPWAVMDALVAAGLSRLTDLSVVGGDINPRVVSHLQRSHDAAPTLNLVGGVRETAGVALSADYREYFDSLGRAIAEPGGDAPARAAADGRLRKRVRVGPAAARALSAVPIDIVTERLRARTFDLVIATNVLPYFDDGELALAVSNIASMLAPGGVFLHNESRPAFDSICREAGLLFEQSRHAVVATVRGAPGPLVDSVWLHRKAASPPR